jgi:hypothetical protein
MRLTETEVIDTRTILPTPINKRTGRNKEDETRKLEYKIQAVHQINSEMIVYRLSRSMSATIRMRRVKENQQVPPADNNPPRLSDYAVITK